MAFVFDPIPSGVVRGENVEAAGETSLACDGQFTATKRTPEGVLRFGVEPIERHTRGMGEGRVRRTEVG